MRKALLVVAAAAAFLTGACGSDDPTVAGDHDKVDMSSSSSTSSDSSLRTVTVTMRDNLFEPDEVSATVGQVVRFVFVNKGTVKHDAFIGDEAAQAAHESSMTADSSAHDVGLDNAEAVVIEPGKTGEIGYSFESAGTVYIGCHEPGHYAGGMKVTVTVT